MATFKEVLFMSDESETANTVQCYDLQLGVRVMTYKNGRGVGRRTLSFIQEDYVITAELSKPFLHVWTVNKEEPCKRISMPGKVTALSVSTNGIYAVAGIENKIYVWNVASGQLLKVISYHHEPITKIAFWNCSYFVTCGEDGLVAVWRLADVVSLETGETFSVAHLRSIVTFFSSSQHSLPVTDMHLASSGSTARLFTVSGDQTCQIFSLGPEGGKFLLTITFDYILNSVIVDRLQRRLFVGTDCGRVVIYPLEPCHNTDSTARHVDSSNDDNSLLGHTACVTALSLSREDTVLASGSHDKKVILWNLSTGQQIGVHQMFGSVSDVMFRVVTGDFLAIDRKPKCLLSIFERTVVSDPENIEIKVLVQDDVTWEDSGFEDEVPSPSKRGRPWCLPAVMPDGQRANSVNPPKEEAYEGEKEFGEKPDFDMGHRGTDSSDVTRLRIQNRRLKKINKRLYLFALEQMFQNGHIKQRPHEK